MSLMLKSTVSALALMALSAMPAAADVTPEEVWQNWQDASAAMGQTLIAATTTRDGDTLRIENITIASAAEGVTAEGNLAQISMKDQGDGTVLVTMSPEYPIKMTLPATEAGKPEVQVNLLVTQDDLKMIASGDAGAISYDMTAPTVKIKLDRVEGAAGQAANLTVDATLTDLAGTYATQQVADGMTANSDVTAGGLALAVIAGDPVKKTELRGTASMAGLAFKTEGALLGAALGAGMMPEALAKAETKTEFTTETTTFEMEIAEASGNSRFSGTMGQGAMRATILGGMMDYSGSQKAVQLTINSPSIPVPDVSITLDDYSFAVKLPVAPSPTAAPFAFSTNLTNLALSEQLWALFDPAANLPRDPINLVLDMDGTSVVNAAPADPAAPPMLPATLETLNLKQLNLRVAGAELTGAGTSTFAPDDKGVPNPNAKLDFKLTGANGLMDKLVAAGLLTPEMLTFPRMMLAMVANPAADGSDGYDSTITIQDKAVSANGQVLYQLP